MFFPRLIRMIKNPSLNKKRMIMKQYMIETVHLNDWLTAIINSVQRVLAPVKDGQRVYFRPVTSANAVDYEGQTTTESVKEASFPRTEELFSYHKSGKDVSVAEVPDGEYPETVVWRARPCDAAGFSPLDAIFNWDYKDAVYNRRRNKLTIVTFSCTSADEFCFCTSVGGGPGNKAGSDLFVTDLQNGSFLIEVLTEKGQELIKKSSVSFQEVTGSFAEEKEAAIVKLPIRFSKEEVHRHLEHAFKSKIWKEQSARCLGCGACAFVCPTCACFDIQEKNEGSKGARLRCWDSCGFSLFTMHTGGYNPRPTQQTRWRQRILHKFSYMPDRLQVFGCTGCGRCSRACPVEMDIAEHLTSIAAYHE